MVGAQRHWNPHCSERQQSPLRIAFACVRLCMADNNDVDEKKNENRTRKRVAAPTDESDKHTATSGTTAALTSHHRQWNAHRMSACVHQCDTRTHNAHFAYEKERGRGKNSLRFIVPIEKCSTITDFNAVGKLKTWTTASEQNIHTITSEESNHTWELKTVNNIKKCEKRVKHTCTYERCSWSAPYKTCSTADDDFVNGRQWSGGRDATSSSLLKNEYVNGGGGGGGGGEDRTRPMKKWKRETGRLCRRSHTARHIVHTRARTSTHT